MAYRLLIDIGNTRTKFALSAESGLADGGDDTGFIEGFDLPSRESIYAETPQPLQALYDRYAGQLSGGICLGGVVPAVETRLIPLLERLFPEAGPAYRVVSGKTPTDVDFSRYDVAALGTDRLLDICAVSRLYPEQTAFVADFGTATTLDAVSADGQYLGGTIFPGISTFFNILHEKTAKLPPMVPGGPLQSAFGVDTLSSLEAGLTYGYLGLVERVFTEMTVELSTKGQLIRPVFVATGGLAAMYQAMAASGGRGGEPPHRFDVVDPDLTLKGLEIVYRRACCLRGSVHGS